MHSDESKSPMAQNELILTILINPYYLYLQILQLNLNILLKCYQPPMNEKFTGISSSKIFSMPPMKLAEYSKLEFCQCVNVGVREHYQYVELFASLSLSYLFTWKSQLDPYQKLVSYFTISCYHVVKKQNLNRHPTSSCIKRGERLPDPSHVENFVE